MRDLTRQIKATENLILMYEEKVAKGIRAIKDEIKHGGLSNNTVRYLKDDAGILSTYCDQWWVLKMVRDTEFLPDDDV